MQLTSITGKISLVISGVGILMWMVAGVLQIMGIANNLVESMFCIGTYLIPLCVIGVVLGSVSLFSRPNWTAFTAIVMGALGIVWLIGSATEMRSAGSGHIARELNRWGWDVEPHAVELLNDGEGSP